MYDKISDYLDMVAMASELPSKIIGTGTFNIWDTLGSAPFILYPSLLQYVDEVNKYCSCVLQTYFAYESLYFSQ